MDGTVVDAEFIAWVKARFPAFVVNITPRKDWVGQVDEDTTLEEPPNLPCKRWFGISIMATGQATMCCMDGQGEWPIGDVSTESVIDIYNSDSFRAIRRMAQTRQAVPACRGCSYI